MPPLIPLQGPHSNSRMLLVYSVQPRGNDPGDHGPLARSVGIQPVEAKTDNRSGDWIIHWRPMSAVLHGFTEGFPPFTSRSELGVSDSLLLEQIECD